jgi:uncharacterized protein YcbX
VEIVSLHVYPIKSCRGIDVRRARVEKRGLALDRRWMIAAPDGEKITQREEPRLALVDVAVEDGAIRIAIAGVGDAVLPITTERGTRMSVDVWGRKIEAVIDERASALIGAHLGRGVCVVHLPDSVPSPSASRFARAGDEVSFADGYPVLIATEESLADLGDRIEARGGERVPMVRFRPNVVVRGAPAWDEDGWGEIAIGAVPMRAPKACDRCVMTTIDPATAKLGPEPLRTLASFRRRDNGVWFAVNLVPDADGEVAIGDEVRVTRRIPVPAFDVAPSQR